MSFVTPELCAIGERLRTQDNRCTAERLAAIIREVDGGHSLGAAALAEAILGHPDICLPPEEKPAPPPASPDDGDFEDLCCEYGFQTEDAESQETLFQMFRDVLARWGTTPTPIPIAERLPEEVDCDTEGRCWWYMAPHVVGIFRKSPTWCLGKRVSEDFGVWTHWCASHALPLPSRPT